MIARSLSPDDLAWALDHSTRHYRVRETRAGDSPHVRDPAPYITVVPLNGAQPTVLAPRCTLFSGGWEDTDRYAIARLDTVAMAGAARAQRMRPPADAVRLGHDFGSWCAEVFRGERLAQRVPCESRAHAWSEVRRLAATGLRLLPNAPSTFSHGGRA